jgi:hypothetical protein
MRGRQAGRLPPADLPPAPWPRPENSIQSGALVVSSLPCTTAP